METSIPGVYAVGDIRNTPFKQVVVAASEGCIAAMSIDKYLSGRSTVKVDWIHNIPHSSLEPSISRSNLEETALQPTEKATAVDGDEGGSIW